MLSFIKKLWFNFCEDVKLKQEYLKSIDNKIKQSGLSDKEIKIYYDRHLKDKYNSCFKSNCTCDCHKH